MADIAAGTLYIQQEVALSKLQRDMAQAENIVTRSTKRMERATGGTNGGGLFAGGLFNLGAKLYAGLTLAQSSIVGISAGLETAHGVAAALNGDIQGFGDGLVSGVNELKKLPGIGAAIVTPIDSLVRKWSGADERAKRYQATLQAVAASQRIINTLTREVELTGVSDAEKSRIGVQAKIAELDAAIAERRKEINANADRGGKVQFFGTQKGVDEEASAHRESVTQLRKMVDLRDELASRLRYELRLKEQAAALDKAAELTALKIERAQLRSDLSGRPGEFTRQLIEAEADMKIRQAEAAGEFEKAKLLREIGQLKVVAAGTAEQDRIKQGNLYALDELPGRPRLPWTPPERLPISPSSRQVDLSRIFTGAGAMSNRPQQVEAPRINQLLQQQVEEIRRLGASLKVAG